MKRNDKPVGVLTNKSRPNEVADITRVLNRDGHLWYEVRWPNGIGSGGLYRDDNPDITYTLFS